MQINKIYLSLGSNIGNTERNIEVALDLLKEGLGNIINRSINYITEPMYLKDQNNFCNMVCIMETKSSPEECLFIIENIMTKMGRVREIKNGPRVIDIDILYFSNFDFKLKSNDLEIPHPKIYEREFVTKPLIEVLINFLG